MSTFDLMKISETFFAAGLIALCKQAKPLCLRREPELPSGFICKYKVREKWKRWLFLLTFWPELLRRGTKARSIFLPPPTFDSTHQHINAIAIFPGGNGETN